MPDRNFAVVALSNQGPDSILFNKEIINYSLNNYLGVTYEDPEPVPFNANFAAEIIGAYENEVMTLFISVKENIIQLHVIIKPEILAASDKELPPDHLPFIFGMVPGKKDEYIITSGAFKGQRGFLSRNENNAVVGIDLAGRLFKRLV